MFCKKPAEEGKPRRNHGCLWAIVIGLLAYLGMSILMGMMMGSLFSSSSKLEKNTVYQLKMKGLVVEQGEEDNPFASAFGEMPFAGRTVEKVGLNDLCRNIRLAAEDERIKGIILRGGELQIAPASAKTLRDELLNYKKSGKFLIAYADRYDQLNYYVASSADKIFLNATGSVAWNGLTAQKMYYTRLLQKVGVEMQVLKVGTFKSAVEPFFRTSMSDEDKAQTKRYIDGIWSEMRRGVSDGRGITEDQLDVLADRCMELQEPEEYVATGMVDSLIYHEDVDSILTAMTGTEDYNTISTSSLASVKRDTHKADNKIAIVYAEGEISDDGTSGIVGKKLVKLFGEIGEEDDVKAVVFRVNSPGGSADASEQIWHAVTMLQKKGIPVVVSMGNYAASGGYYISSPADYIFAEPTTLTGSIGIFGMIPSFATLRDKVGLDIDGISTHRHAALGANMTYRGMNDEERALMQKMINRGYDLFTRRCAEGRQLSQDSIKSIGEGRVWLGIDALNLGLVDQLGNINDAVVKAADLAELTDYQLEYSPEKKDFLTELMEMMDKTTEEERLYMHLKSVCEKPRIMMLMDRVDFE